MRALAQRLLLFISLLLISGAFYAQPLRQAQKPSFPTKEGECARYMTYIEMTNPSASSETSYISGICMLQHEGTIIKGCLFNEFGITALSFSYNLEKHKVKLHDVLPMLNKWYIRKVLKKDLRQVMFILQKGESTYRNQRRGITYNFEYETER